METRRPGQRFALKSPLFCTALTVGAWANAATEAAQKTASRYNAGSLRFGLASLSANGVRKVDEFES
jgi:hypothetical protein